VKRRNGVVMVVLMMGRRMRVVGKRRRSMRSRWREDGVDWKATRRRTKESGAELTWVGQVRGRVTEHNRSSQETGQHKSEINGIVWAIRCCTGEVVRDGAVMKREMS
jgi:hypothetical protein